MRRVVARYGLRGVQVGRRPTQALRRDCGQEEVEFDPDLEVVI